MRKNEKEKNAEKDIGNIGAVNDEMSDKQKEEMQNEEESLNKNQKLNSLFPTLIIKPQIRAFRTKLSFCM